MAALLAPRLGLVWTELEGMCLERSSQSCSVEMNETPEEAALCFRRVDGSCFQQDSSHLTKDRSSAPHTLLEDRHRKAAEAPACCHSAEEFLDSILMDSGKLPHTFASPVHVAGNIVSGGRKILSRHSRRFSQLCIERTSSSKTDLPFVGQPQKAKQTTDQNPGNRPLDLFKAIFEDDSD